MPLSTHSRTTQRIRASLKRRHRKEMRFRWFGILAICIGFAFLLTLVSSVVSKSMPAWSQTWIQLEVHYDPERLGIEAAPEAAALANANYRGIVKQALRKLVPEARGRRDQRELGRLLSFEAEYQVKDALIAHPEWLGTTQTLWVLAHDKVDYFVGNNGEGHTTLSKKLTGWVKKLMADGKFEQRFATELFTNGASREAELAGIAGSMVGSLLTLIVTLFASFPIAVAAAIYLEEFAPRNWLTDLIEININNLAAVPSIVFGLLGLAIFINFFGLPRSAPLVGGLVLSLMTLPTIIISARAALKSVPPSIREAAVGLGASKMQVVFHHVLPLAMPGILTGTIIGMAQALGESAPLLMIGMVAFIADIPQGFTDAATVLPVQIYLWSDYPEAGFIAKTSAAIVVLLGFLGLMNLAAILLRKKLERSW